MTKLIDGNYGIAECRDELRKINKPWYKKSGDIFALIAAIGSVAGLIFIIVVDVGGYLGERKDEKTRAYFHKICEERFKYGTDGYSNCIGIEENKLQYSRYFK